MGLLAHTASEPAGSPRLRGERGTCPQYREACQLSGAVTASRTGNHAQPVLPVRWTGLAVAAAA
jgi:hypothetical protein